MGFAGHSVRWWMSHGMHDGGVLPRELERIRGLVVRLPKHTCVVIRVTCRLIPIYWLV